MPLSPALRSYDAVLLALEGCLWVGDEPTPGAAEALAVLREAGKEVVFVTNDPRPSVEDVVRRLWALGFRASVREVVTAGAAVQHLLARRGGGSAFVIGSQALVDHVADAGLRIVNNTGFASRADVVVVANHDALRYVELRVAVQAVLRGAQLIGAARDATVASPDGPCPGPGAILAAVEVAVGRAADQVAGMPEAPLYETALERLGGGRVLAVGDRLGVDVAGAHAFGLDAALVLSGASSERDLEGAEPRPRFVAADLASLVLAGAS